MDYKSLDDFCSLFAPGFFIFVGENKLLNEVTSL